MPTAAPTIPPGLVFFAVWKLADLGLRTAGRLREKLPAPGRARPGGREALEIDAEQAYHIALSCCRRLA